jgi:zinc transporter 1
VYLTLLVQTELNIPLVIENPQLVLCTGVAGLVVNVLGMFLFHGHGHGHHHHHKQEDGHSDHEEQDAHISIHPAETYAKVMNAVQEQKRAIQVANCSNEDETDVISETSTDPLVQEVTVLQMPSAGHGESLSSQSHSHGQRHSQHHSHGHNHSRGHSHKHGGHSHHHHEGASNMHGIFLHVLGDALGSVGVILSAAFNLYTDYSWKHLVDPIARYAWHAKLSFALLTFSFPVCY